jgi:hypothetical protein
VSFVEQNLLGIRVTRGELADDIVAAVEGAVTLPELVTDAPLVVVRRRDGRAVEAAQAGGTRVAVDPEARGNRGRLRDAPLVVQ